LSRFRYFLSAKYHPARSAATTRAQRFGLKIKQHREDFLSSLLFKASIVAALQAVETVP
jgi:hypothetical protein